MIFGAIKGQLLQARRARVERKLGGEADRVDAFLVSYPKSGRTWLRYILSHYLAGLAELGFEPDLNSTFRVLPNFDLLPDRGLPAFVGKSERLPLIAVSHLAYAPALFHRRPVILKVRDPRDVTVSAYFHQTRQKRRFSGTMADFIEDPDLGVPAIIAYHNGWANALLERKHLVVSYERLRADPHKESAAILDFLDLPIDRGLLEAAIAAGDFDRMRSLEIEDGIPGHRYDRLDGEALRMRKGKVGGFTDYLSATEIARIETLCQTGLSPAAKALFGSAV
jgi:alcohol sulfotransferase